jgi:hypothetical protein
MSKRCPRSEKCSTTLRLRHRLHQKMLPTMKNLLKNIDYTKGKKLKMP